MFGIFAVNSDEFFKLHTITKTRGHKFKLYKPQCSCNIRKHFFTERVVDVWNSIPPSVNFSSLVTFKRDIRNVDFSQFLTLGLED